MAEIVQFPRHDPNPGPRLVWPPATAEADSLAVMESNAAGRESVAKALENLASVNVELCCVNILSLQKGGDVTELVTEEVLIGLCHALISVIDARGVRNRDRPLATPWRGNSPTGRAHAMTTETLRRPLALPANARFTVAMAGLNIRMPLRHDTTHCGTIVDADGNMVCVVDIHGERSDGEVSDIVELLLLAVNVHAGFLPEGK